MALELNGAVVVLTGASSGIGRCAAHGLAREGANLVLASRSESTLLEAAGECERLGAEVLPVVTDVRDEARRRGPRLRRDRALRAHRRLGQRRGRHRLRALRGDAVGGLSRRHRDEPLRDGPRRARRAAALPPPGVGTLINVASVWARVPSPAVSPYVTSKFAIRAFSDCLRQKLADSPGIEVATILPQAVDSPIFRQAANYVGRQVRPIPPVIDPEDVADGIVRCARSPKREVTYSRAGRLLEALHTLAPRVWDRVFAPGFESASFNGEPSDSGPGNVLRPNPAAERIHGNWKRDHRGELARALGATVKASLLGLVRGPGTR